MGKSCISQWGQWGGRRWHLMAGQGCNTVVGGICGHVNDGQPTVTSETRSAGCSYPIMSGMLAVTWLRLFLLSVARAW